MKGGYRHRGKCWNRCAQDRSLLVGIDMRGIGHYLLESTCGGSVITCWNRHAGDRSLLSCDRHTCLFGGAKSLQMYGIALSNGLLTLLALSNFQIGADPLGKPRVRVKTALKHGAHRSRERPLRMTEAGDPDPFLFWSYNRHLISSLVAIAWHGSSGHRSASGGSSSGRLNTIADYGELQRSAPR